MIAKLAGVLDLLGDDHVVVDVGGVGYLVHCSARTLARCPAPGSPVSLVVETQAREHDIQLYGFLDAAERVWFRRLTAIQGIGAKVALGVQSALGPGELVQAVAAGDTKSIARAPGVGPRLAGRIATELRGSLGDDDGMPAGDGGPGAGGAEGDAVSALVNLGYGRAEAHGAVAAAARAAGGGEVGELVRAALQELAR